MDHPQRATGDHPIAIALMVGDMYEQSELPALAKFLNGEAVTSAEEAAQIEQSVRLLSWEVSPIGNGPAQRRSRSIWPWRSSRRRR